MNSKVTLGALSLMTLLACNQAEDPVSSETVESGKGDYHTKGKPVPFDISLMSPEDLERLKPGHSQALKGSGLPLAKSASPLETVGFPARKSTNSCPNGAVTIFMDDEDGGNGTEVKYRNLGQPWTYDDNQYPWENPLGGDTRFHFCMEQRTYLKRILRDYVVLRLSGSCPSNGYPFARIIDNEDGNNRNWNSGNIWPSSQGSAPTHGWTRLEFCFVPKDPAACDPYSNCDANVEYENAWAYNHVSTSTPHYGAFVEDIMAESPGDGVNWPWTGSWAFKGLSDDEDYANANSWEFYGMSTDFQNRVKNIIRETPHTTYYTLRTNF